MLPFAANSLFTRLALALCGACALAATAGCWSSDGVETAYGRRSGEGGKSVAGTGVLAEQFRAAGYTVSSDKKLSPVFNKYNVIVWAPDSFAEPDLRAVGYLHKWLQEGSDRTLIYIGRDYDAVSDYWRRVQPQAPPDQAIEVARRLALSQSDHAARRRKTAAASSTWFDIKPAPVARPAQRLTGPWSASIDASKAEISVGHELVCPVGDYRKLSAAGFREAQVMLAADGSPLITLIDLDGFHGCQLIVVANGSFLLNLPLVNPEHRKLSALLVNACGPPESVLFLESGPEGPAYSEQAAPKRISPFQWLTVWPIGIILVHMFLAGIVMCAWLFPIFGRPRTLPAATRSDFGKHVESLGEMLAATGDAAFAQAHLQQYQQVVRPETLRTAVGQSLTGGHRRDDRDRKKE